MNLINFFQFFAREKFKFISLFKDKYLKFELNEWIRFFYKKIARENFKRVKILGLTLWQDYWVIMCPIIEKICRWECIFGSKAWQNSRGAGFNAATVPRILPAVCIWHGDLVVLNPRLELSAQAVGAREMRVLSSRKVPTVKSFPACIQWGWGCWMQKFVKNSSFQIWI